MSHTKFFIEPGQLNTHRVRFVAIEAEVTGTEEVQTNLTEVLGCVAMLTEDAALTGHIVTWAEHTQSSEPGILTLKVWKPTATGDCTPIASTGAKTVHALVWGYGEQTN